jgi:hypothetical protein
MLQLKKEPKEPAKDNPSVPEAPKFIVAPILPASTKHSKDKSEDFF